MVDNRMGDNHGISIQAGTIHGPVTVHAPPTPAPVPGWVEVALPVHQAQASELGVHNSLPGTEDAGLPPYVARDVDEELDQRLATLATSPRGGLVLVTGASTAGKTRALSAALDRTMPERMLVAPPEDTDLRPLPTWLKQGAACAPQGWVVWLDDLDRHLAASGLTPSLVTELGHAGAVVAATIRQNHLQALHPSSTDHTLGAGVGYAVLKTPPILLERRWTPTERERARASADERLVRAAADERFGVAEQLAAGPVLESIWRSGPDSGHPRGYALVAAAVGLAQAGVSSPLTQEQIHDAHSTHLPAPPPMPEEADQAWAWATRPRSGLAGLLVPADHDGLRWRAFDYLTLHGPLPEAVWHTALDPTYAEDHIDVGLTASRANRADIAETAYLALAERGHTGAMNNLGVLLAKAGRIDEAEHWFREAAEQGHIGAMNNLGILLRNTGQVEAAQTWFRTAADQGNSEAMVCLGVLLRKTGRVEEAKTWYQRAIEQGHIGAMNNLGILLKKMGQVKEARTWFREAALQGQIDAMNNLGVLLAEAGRAEKAEHCFHEAALQGHAEAMNNLGTLLERTDQLGQAQTWYSRAAEQGHTSAMNNLGVMREEAGRLEEAETWYLRAIDHGFTAAMLNLGLLLRRTGRSEEAMTWFHRAGGS